MPVRRLAGAHNDRGVEWAKKGQHDRAIADFNTAIGLWPDYPKAFTNRGDSWKAKGDNARATADFNQAKQLKQ